MHDPGSLQLRSAPLEMSPEEFRARGHETVDRVADFLSSLAKRPVTRGESPSELRRALKDTLLPAHGLPAERLLEETATLLFEHSLFNGHPRFWGYITSSAAPIGALGDLLGSAVNPNVGSSMLSPIATEIEAQTVRWIAELMGYPAGGGLLVSGGNMANFVCFVAARRAKAPWHVREVGMNAKDAVRLRVYASKETHTWIQKAADLFGLGTDSIRWIATDPRLQMDMAALRRAITADRAAGDLPFLVVGTAGSVSTGAVDPLAEIAAIAAAENIWFHVDGAYGALAAALPDASADLKALSLADSVAVDPHKWLYAPLEAGCALVRDKEVLREAFSYHPPYYHFDSNPEDAPTNYYELGPQNSRGFRALKVWLAFRQVGRAGYERMIEDDCRLARALFDLVSREKELQACTHALSITTFRYVPGDLRASAAENAEYLDALNTALLDRLQKGGEAFVSNAVLDGRFVLRTCIVNFRTRLADIEALPEIVVRLGREVDAEKRPGRNF
jgi:aromatic-L-amino-acid/L-tryptophan decarboxylase